MRNFRWVLLVAALLPLAAAQAVPGLYSAGTVAHALRLPDGSTIATGSFTSVGEVPRAGVARLTPQGALDAAWTGSGLPAIFALQVVALAASPDGTRVYLATPSQVVALATSGSGAAVPGFSVIASGSVDGFNSGIGALRTDAAGALYLGGAFAKINGQSRNGLARVASDGVLDASWMPAVNGTVAALDIDESADRLYLGGAFVTVGGSAHLRLARVLLSDGCVAADWSPAITSASDGVHALALAPGGGSLLLAGSFTAVNGTARSGIARIATADAALEAWSPALLGGAVRALAASATQVYAGGDSGCCNGAALARFAAADGSADAAWTPLPNGSVKALFDDGAGGALAFGAFDHAGGTTVLGAAALGGDGSASHALPDFEYPAAATSAAPLPSGAVILGGNFAKAEGAYRPGLLRLQADGTIDTLFQPPRFAEGNASGAVLAVTASEDETTLYVGGSFTQVGGVAQARLARLDATSGALDASWAPAIPSGQGRAIAVDGDDVFIGGTFASVAGSARANFARLTAAGTFAPQATGGTNGAVDRIVLTADAAYLAGDFLSPRTRLAKQSRSDGNWDASWNPQFDWLLSWSDVNDLQLAGTTLLASLDAAVPFGGGFVEVGELVAIDADGGAQPLARLDAAAATILPARDGGSVYLAGLFRKLYALDDFFAQTQRPAGLAQVSLRGGTFGALEAWSPSVPLADGLPGLLPLGDGGLLAGARDPVFIFPRAGLFALDLPPGDFLFRDGFGP
jgi:hypothetical protein